MDWYFLLTLNPLFPILFPLYLIYRPPRPLIRLLQKKFPDVLFHHPTSSKIIALTIDDAPSEYTADILAILAQHNAKATFFCIGSQFEGKEDILQNVVRAGHELGNHTMHDEPSVNLPTPELSVQIKLVDTMIQSIYAAVDLSPPPRYFRPGSGFFNKSMRELVKSLGYRLILGSIYPHDPQIHNPKVNAWHIVSMADRGGVIIVHDRRGYTCETLRIALPKLVKMGYQIVTVSDLMARTGGWTDETDEVAKAPRPESKLGGQLKLIPSINSSK
jgi:peptidoglycan/xylan/chitin deacetylase (PgdA/CDA1 family)